MISCRHPIYSNADILHCSCCCERLQVNVVSKRVEYHGEVPELVKAIVDIPAGGQVWMDSATFAGQCHLFPLCAGYVVTLNTIIHLLHELKHPTSSAS